MQQPPAIKPLMFVAFIAILLMSFVPVIIRWVSANEATIGIIRLGIGAAGIGLILLMTKKWQKLRQREMLWLGLLGLFFALHWFSYFKSIKMSSASLASIGVATFGIHLLLLNYLILKEKLKISDFIAVLLSLTGIYIASPENTALSSIHSLQESGKLDGFLLAIFSGFLYACLPLINRQLTQLSTNMRAFGQFSGALVLFLCLLPQADFNLPATDWHGLIILGVFSTLIAHTLWIKASTELPTSFTAVIYYGYVPLALFFSYLFLNEPLTWQKLTGATLIICANILVAVLHKRNNKK